MDNMQIKIAAESNIGLRRNNNEDRFAICPSLAAAQWNGTCAETSLPDRTDGAMIVMADGMGDIAAEFHARVKKITEALKYNP